MTMLVTLEQAKARLRFSHDEEDADLTGLIEGASGAVLNYLGVDADVFLDVNWNNSDSSGVGYVSSGSSSSDSDETGPVYAVPDEVQLAVLILVGILSRDRDGVDMKDWEHGYLPRPVLALLYPLRDPAIG